NRRQRRAKTDRMDVKKLVRQLVRYWRGERDVGRVARVPSPEAEDSRQLHRGLEVLKEERKQHRVRIQSLLYTQGIDMKVGAKFLQKLEQLRCWNQEPIAAQMQQRIQDECHRLQLVQAQIRELIIEIAWAWLRLQPNSKLSQWYNERFAKGGARMRRVGIVALARRLVIDLWRYLESGTVPEGAQLKASASSTC